jgi:hypothetical protein
MEETTAIALPAETRPLLDDVIRKQRNIVVRGDTYKTTHVGRILMSLFAASLLWPEFPED